MNCDFFRVVVHELVRGHVSDVDLRECLLDHARRCAGCAICLSEAQEESAGLTALSASDANEQAPARVEAALLDYLRKQRRARNRRRREKWLAAAAVVVAAGAGVCLRQYRHSPPARVESATPAKPGRGEMKWSGPSRAPSRVKANATAATPSTLDSGFILLPYGQNAPLVSGAEIVRVAVTPAALASIGVPVPDPSADTYLEADLIVGDDGVARAIRLGSDSSQ